MQRRLRLPRTLTRQSPLLLLPPLLLLAGCPDDDDDSAAGDDDASEEAVEDAFEAAAGMETMRCTGVSAADPAATFTVDQIYGITVDAPERALRVVANDGMLSRTWDGIDDEVEGDLQDGQVTITVRQEGGGMALVRWNAGFDGLTSAEFVPDAGSPVYSFIAQER